MSRLWRGHTSTCFSGVVPRQWAQRAPLWFQRSQLQLSALCSTASKQNTTKPEGRLRNLSSLLVLKKKKSLPKRGKGREACPFDVDFAVAATEGRRIPPCPCLSAQGRFWTFPPVPILASVNLKQPGIPSVLTHDTLWVVFFFQCQMRNYFSRSLLFANDLFLSKNAPQDIANRWEPKSLAGAGTPCLCRSNA